MIIYYLFFKGRIVSLTLGTDEILLDMIGPERIVALTKFAHDPGISNVVAKAAQVRGKIVDVNVEAVLSHQPDLVIYAADVMYQHVYLLLRDMGVPIYVYNNIRSVDAYSARNRIGGRAVGRVGGSGYPRSENGRDFGGGPAAGNADSVFTTANRVWMSARECEQGRFVRQCRAGTGRESLVSVRRPSVCKNDAVQGKHHSD